MQSHCPGRESHTFKRSASQLICQNYQCHYTDHHPVNYNNQVKGFNDQLSRCEQILDQKDQQFIDYVKSLNDFKKNKKSMIKEFFVKSRVYINRLCHLIRQNNPRIIGRAMEYIKTLISLKLGRLFQRRNDSRWKSGNQRVCHYTCRKLACWAVYCACWREGDYYEEQNIAKFMQLPVQQWIKQTRHLKTRIQQKLFERTKNTKFQPFKDILPRQTSASIIFIMTRQFGYQVNEQVKNIMVRLCQKIQTQKKVDLYHDIIAVGVFFEVCERTEGLQGEYTLSDICQDVRMITSSVGLGITNEFKVNDCHELKALLKKQMKPVLDTIFETVYWEGKIEPNGREEIMMGREC